MPYRKLVERDMNILRIRNSFVVSLTVLVAVVLTGSLNQAGVQAKERMPAGQVSAPARGGPFTLTDHRGKTVSDRDFRGKFMLVYFGYTYCPDVCPTGLSTMAATMDSLGETGELVVPIFVSVDPERDTVDVLADYVTVFHPRLVGLTGTVKQAKTAAKNYGARAFKVFDMPQVGDDETEQGGSDENSRYSVSHSADTYLVSPESNILTVFSHDVPAAEMATGIQKTVADWTSPAETQ